MEAAWERDKWEACGAGAGETRGPSDVCRGSKTDTKGVKTKTTEVGDWGTPVCLSCAAIPATVTGIMKSGEDSPPGDRGQPADVHLGKGGCGRRAPAKASVWGGLRTAPEGSSHFVIRRKIEERDRDRERELNSRKGSREMSREVLGELAAWGGVG